MSSIAAPPLAAHIPVTHTCECIEDIDSHQNEKVEQIQLLGTLAKEFAYKITAQYKGEGNSNMSSPNHGATPQIISYNQIADSQVTSSAEVHDEQYGPFVSGLNVNHLNDVRLRSESLSSINKPTTQRHTAPSVAIPSDIQRLSQQESTPPYRFGSVDNLSVQHSHARQQLVAMHASQTFPDIHPRSGDSGYHTPPFTNRRPNTSPPNQNRFYPPNYSTNDHPLPLRTDPPPLLNQPLSVEIGHFEPEGPALSIAEPLTVHGQGYFDQKDILYQTNYLHTNESQSLPVQRLVPTTPEEGVLGYQFQRKDRLHQAYDNLEQELSLLEVENDELTMSIKKLETEKQRDERHIFDKEIQNMTQENQKLAIGIQALLKVLPEVQFQQQSTARPTVNIPAQPHGGNQPNSYRRNTAPSRPNPPSFPTETYPYQPPASAPPHFRPPPSHGRMDPRVSDADDVPDNAKWSCGYCTLLNHPLINVCEACERPRKHRVQAMLSSGAV